VLTREGEMPPKEAKWLSQVEKRLALAPSRELSADGAKDGLELARNHCSQSTYVIQTAACISF
jgi:hypothetical protein